MSEDQNKEKLKKQIILERSQEASIVRKIVAVCLLLFIIGFAVAGTSGYFFIKGALSPVDEQDDTIVEVTIPIGSSTARIGAILEEHGVIRNSSIFHYYIRYKNESGFQAGDYQLTRAMDMDEIIASLKEGTVYQHYALAFTIPEGRWLESIVTIIANNTEHEVETIMEVITDEEYVQELIGRYSVLTEDILDPQIRYALEGYLFPARYDFVEENPSIKTIIEAMIQRTEQVVSKYYDEIEESNYSIHEIMSLASIVEGEAQKSEDRYIISGVLYNRLDRNMKLEVDPTVAYAHGEHLPRTLYAHLDIASPYNTYYITGIPIGPINNPGEASIKATLQPNEHNYLFFYADATGHVHYTETFSEHQAILRQYRD